jgi:hypothetical protein
MNLILHPSGKEKPDDVNRASRQSVSLFRRYLTPDQEGLVDSTFPDGFLYARGLTRGANGANHTKWLKIESGDRAIFFRNKRLIGTGFVVLKISSVALSDHLGWGVDLRTKLPYELIYAVKDLRPLNIEIRQLFRIIGYANPDQVGF